MIFYVLLSRTILSIEGSQSNPMKWSHWCKIVEECLEEGEVMGADTEPEMITQGEAAPRHLSTMV